jgi:hypothetical protein
MRSESRRGPNKKKEKKTHFVSGKAYLSCYFFINPIPLHFKDNF